MIHVEEYRIGDRTIQKTYSNIYRIRQIETNLVYDEANDILPCRYTYEETEELLAGEVSDEEAFKELIKVMEGD